MRLSELPTLMSNAGMHCRCNRENRHRGLCNSRATIPGAEAYNQNAEPAVEKQQTVAGTVA